ncbi:cation transporter [Alicyclobacillus kakegawensis]|uniref:cation transporter n=1 Tax=Alicyclobacillus kakegawensis TaxID=392012 RepID=UPI0008356F1A|nr:cation transporter [Alicyclobacillus kakegawensis]
MADDHAGPWTDWELTGPDRVKRARWLSQAIAWETASLIWIGAESVLSLWAARRHGGMALSAFGIDSAIELLSGLCLLARLVWEWRRPKDARAVGVLPVERATAVVVGACLLVLALWIAWGAGAVTALRSRSSPSALGLAVAAVSSLLTPWLAGAKRRLGRQLDSAALRADAACTLTCAFMAWLLLGGQALQRVGGWWWVDPLASAAICVLILHEAWESLEAGLWRRHGHGHGHGVV